MVNIATALSFAILCKQKQITTEKKQDKMNTLFKDMAAGATVHALVKGEELRYVTGTVVSIGQPRVDIPNPIQGIGQGYKQVVDVTFAVDGKNYTEAVEVTACMFPTNKLGGVSLVATDTEPIVRELRATEKLDADYLKQTESEIPKREKRIEACKQLIAELDTDYKEKRETEDRFIRIEKKQEEFGGMLKRILDAVENK